MSVCEGWAGDCGETISAEAQPAGKGEDDKSLHCNQAQPYQCIFAKASTLILKHTLHPDLPVLSLHPLFHLLNVS